MSHTLTYWIGPDGHITGPPNDYLSCGCSQNSAQWMPLCYVICTIAAFRDEKGVASEMCIVQEGSRVANIQQLQVGTAGGRLTGWDQNRDQVS